MVNLQIIKTLAERKNITIRELADKVGIKENQIHVMCRTNSTKIDTLERIACALGVSVTIFFDDDVKVIKTEGDFSPATENGNISIAVGEAVLCEKVKSLEAIIAEKNERIKELKERIEELKTK